MCRIKENVKKNLGAFQFTFETLNLSLRHAIQLWCLSISTCFLYKKSSVVFSSSLCRSSSFPPIFLSPSSSVLVMGEFRKLRET